MSMDTTNTQTDQHNLKLSMVEAESSLWLAVTPIAESSCLFPPHPLLSLIHKAQVGSFVIPLPSLLFSRVPQGIKNDTESHIM